MGTFRQPALLGMADVSYRRRDAGRYHGNA